MIKPYASLIGLTTILITVTATTVGQKLAPDADPCKAPVAKQFDFLVGEWRGVEESVTDGGAMTATSTSNIQVKKVLEGCVIQENWEFNANGKRLFNAILLRSYDTGSQKWRLSYVDNHLNHQSYEGREESGKWSFVRERLVDGKPVLVRITWTSISADKFEQMVERSVDNGQTWKLRSTITYSRKK